MPPTQADPPGVARARHSVEQHRQHLSQPGGIPAPRRPQPIRRRDRRTPRPHGRRRTALVLTGAAVAGLLVGSGYHWLNRPASAQDSGTAGSVAATTAAAPLPSVHHPPCPSSVPVVLSSDPAMHLLSQVAADRLAVPQKELAGACITLIVREQSSPLAAAELSATTSASPMRPDLWLSASPAWVSLARSTPTGASLLPDDGPVFAVSPVVMAALSTSNLAALGGGWQGTLGVSTAASADQRQLALVDPSRSTAGLLTLLGLEQSAKGSGSGTAQAVTALAALSRRLVVPSDDQSGIRDVLAGRLDAVSATEADVLASAASGTKLVAVQAGRDVPAAQFQVLPVGTPGAGEGLPERDPRTPVSVAFRTAARTIVTRWFTSSEARVLLERAHLRDSTGRMPTGTATTQLPTLEPTAAPRALTPALVSTVLRQWQGAGRRGRVLAVLDVSGSMAQKVPGTHPAATKLQLAVAASRRALASFAPDSDLGLWTFSTRLRGSQDYTELVPVGTLSGPLRGATRRETLDNALASVQVRPHGDTGLYDTTLAAFRSMQRSYREGRLNAVVVLTDGRNDDDGSISRTTLLSTLRAEYDPARPVHVITVGYGADVDVDALKAIAAATHGTATVAKDPRDIDRVLFSALSSL
ncbi:MAG TPA: VWA domain-containing protein [Actinomycetales bacterium]|nr:VWA domain-containing protein [Actinomycetales bacterium]